tara:strand:+ start:1152 stop:1343 length:192 start_codon:yes stop_codon:yes gene_type:complete
MKDKERLDVMGDEALRRIIDSIAWDDEWKGACQFLRAKLKEAYTLGKLKSGVDRIPDFNAEGF